MEIVVLVSKLFEIIFNKQYIKKWQVIFWLNASLLLYLTLMPSIHISIGLANIDKLFHFIGFGAFAFFCLLAFPNLKPLVIVIISSLLGAIVEIVQSYLPYRGFSFADMLADFAGIIAAVSFLWVGKKLARRRVVSAE